MKNLVYILLSAALVMGCSKEKMLERKIKGNYKIEKYEVLLENIQGCSDVPEGISFSVSNPGKIDFTGKKAIDGPDVANTKRPFYGYFDYEFTTVDIFGNTIEKNEKEYFAYDVFPGQSGGGDTLWSKIFIDGVDWDLKLIKDGSRVKAISYDRLFGCYKITHTHYVK